MAPAPVDTPVAAGFAHAANSATAANAPSNLMFMSIQVPNVGGWLRYYRSVDTVVDDKKKDFTKKAKVSP